MSKRKSLNAKIYEKEQELEELRRRQDKLISEGKHGFAELDKKIVKKLKQVENLKKRRGASVQDEIEHLEQKGLI